MTINSYIDELYHAKKKKEELLEQLKNVDETISYLEGIIISSLRSEGLTKASTSLASVSIKPEAVPIIVNWDAIYKYALDEKDLSIFKKELKCSVWREYKEKGLLIPGTESYDKSVLWFHKHKNKP